MADLIDWRAFGTNYRQKEIEQIVTWLREGRSGSVIGLAGSGKSNLLRYICHRPDVMEKLFKGESLHYILVPVDLNDIPDETPATFYRVLLRAIYERQANLPEPLQKKTNALYEMYRTTQDPFLAQSALRELLGYFQQNKTRLGLVFDRFDEFCEMATPYMINALRGLRDRYKGILVFIVGMRQEAAYLADPTILGELYEVIDNHICWVPMLSEADAQGMIDRELRGNMTLNDSERQFLLNLSGRFPSLLKSLIHWWPAVAAQNPALEPALIAALAHPPLKTRLREIEFGLSVAEINFLRELAKNNTSAIQNVNSLNRKSLWRSLKRKGICTPTGDPAICSNLVGAYFEQAGGRLRGPIWFDEETKQIFQGVHPLTGLQPLEQKVLAFMVGQPRARLTKNEIIEGAWPEPAQIKGVTDDSLYQTIASLRRKIEPSPSHPQFIVNWRGKPEGGYQLFPEGRPRSGN
ncbi:MAG: winged helix-turn-helix domain-containing protein [Ardenticatenaceae bacterium]|nr:winged helix-turn-helix domain-containing protein [Ardenticatenaceae bacterium]